MMGKFTNSSLLRKRYLAVLVSLVSIILIAGSYLYFSYEASAIRTSKYNELKTICKLKISQINNWFNQRNIDCADLSKNPFFKNSVRNLIISRNQLLYKEIQKRISLLNGEKKYNNIFITDLNGNILISARNNSNQLAQKTTDFLKKSIKEKKILNTGLYRDFSKNTIYLDFIAPIISKNKVVAALILHINPNTKLYPLISEWPIPSKTSETIIIKKSGHKVTYLNNLRFKSNTALNYKIELTKENRPAIKAALGFRGIFDGSSYRGSRVLAFINSIPGTNWIIITEADTDEIFSTLYFKEFVIFSFTILLIIIVGLGLFWYYHYNQRNVFRELFGKEKILREYHEEFKTVLYSIGDGVITTDINGYIKQMNKTAEDLTGWTENEAHGKPVDEVFTIVNEDSNNLVENPVSKVLKTGNIIGLANHSILINRNKKEIPIADSGAPIKNDKGTIEGVVLVFRDKSFEYQTEKLIRQSKERLNRAEFVSKTGNWELHLDTKIIFASEGAKRIYGLTGDSFDFEDIKEVSLPEYRPMLDKALKELIENNRPYNLEFKIIQHGSKKIIDIHSVAEFDKENKILFGVIQDITDRKKLETKQFRLSEIIENTLNEIYIFDSETLKFEHANRGAIKNIGYSLGELKNLSPINIKPEFTEESFRKILQPLLNGTKDTVVFETIHQRKDGTQYPVEAHHQLHKYGDKKIFFAIINDISERKKAEKKLLESEKRNRTTLYSIGDGVISTDENGKIKQMNYVAEELTGWKEQEAIDKPLEDIFKIINEESRITVESPVNKVLKHGNVVGLANHTLLISKDGNEIPIADSGAPILSNNKNVSGVVLVFRDQSKERAAQNELKQSEIQLKQSQRVARLGYYIFNVADGIWTSSGMLDELFGIDANYQKNIEGWLNIIHPEYKDEMKDYLSNYVLRGKNNFDKEYKIINRKNKKEYWVHGLGEIKFDKTGMPERMFGTIQDITSRKHADIALRESEEKFRNIVNTANEGIMLADENYDITFVNEKLAEMLGYLPSEMIGRYISDFIYDSELGDFERKKLNQSENIFDVYQRKYKRKDGSILFALISTSALFDEKKNFTGYLAMITNITEMKKAEAELRESEKRFRTVYSASPEAISISEIETGKLIEINQAYENLFGYSRNEAIGKSSFELGIWTNENDRRLLIKPFIINGFYNNVEIKFKTKDNAIIYCLASGRIIFIQNKKYMLAILNNITEMKIAGDALRESEERFRNMFEDNSAVMFLVNPDNGKIMDVNKAAVKYYGYKREELLNTSIDQIDTRSFKELKKEIETNRAKGQNHFEFRHKLADGTIRDVEVVFSNVLINNKIYRHSIIHDITSRKQAEEKVRLLAQAVENSEDGIIITDLKNNIIFVNDAFCRIYGYNEKELIGKNITILQSNNFSKDIIESIRLTAMHKGWNGELINKRKDGSDFTIYLSTAPVTDENNEPYALVGIIRDITERVEKEKELTQYRQNLEELVKLRTKELDFTNAQLTEQLRKEKEIEMMLKKSLEKEKELNELKTRFISTTSHEFRTPLTSVLSSAELIQRYGRKWDEDKFEEHVDRIKNSVENITKLLDEVLTISRVESGKINFSPLKLNLYEFCNEIIEEVKPLSKEKHDFLFNYNVESKYYQMDPKLLRSTLVNLLSNAIKYSPDGGRIELNISKANNKLIFTVTDQGMGIPEEDKKHLFEPFHRCINSSEIPGTGLGLSIVQQTVELQKGEISYKSKLGEGSVFTVRLNI